MVPSRRQFPAGPGCQRAPCRSGPPTGRSRSSAQQKNLFQLARILHRAASKVGRGSRRAVFALLSLLSFNLLSLNADVITDWNAAFISALRAETTPPPLAARNLAILHLAIFHALTDAPGKASLPASGNTNDPGRAAARSDEIVRAIGAASEVSISLFPSEKALFDKLRTTGLAHIASSDETTKALALGQKFARQVLESRAADGSATTVPYIPSTKPGAWRRTLPYFRPPEMPHWARVKPFALTNASQFRPPGPPSLQSTNWIRDFNLTKSLGGKNSTQRTPEQTEIARFWSDFSYTSTPPGHWNEIAAQVANQRKLALRETARLFAMLNVALADGAIACWDAKFAYNFWRPVTAIREADRDGNAETSPDQEWEPLLHTPAFPEYVSGHSVFSGAAAEILVRFFGTDEVTFTIGSDGLPGAQRTYHSFRKTAEEIGMSRIYGGIHFLSADLDGLALGKQIADFVCATFPGAQTRAEPRQE